MRRGENDYTKSQISIRGSIHGARSVTSCEKANFMVCFQAAVSPHWEKGEELDFYGVFSPTDYLSDTMLSHALRKGMNMLIGYDLVPEPKILEAVLRACRRLNDLASAIRILEAVKDKAGPHKDIYPYVIQELKPVLSELGIFTPEELGLDKI
uniref:Cytochrome c oxidase subunit 5A, mitochondrial n=2 Tax=Poecilia mexicana TaxID=48701 RepID=A0A3B3X9S6_9TELE